MTTLKPGLNNPLRRCAADMTRRQLFSQSALGLGAAALASLLPRSTLDAAPVLERPGGLPDLPHHPPKAQRAIYLLMNGAPPHIDMFDYKPALEQFRGQEIPESVHRNQRVSTMTQGAKKLAFPAFTGFKQYGQSR